MCEQEGDFEWRHSFCAWTMATEQHQVLVVNDALQDARSVRVVLGGGRSGHAAMRLVGKQLHQVAYRLSMSVSNIDVGQHLLRCPL